MFRTICFAVVLSCSLTAPAAVRSEVSEHYSRRELKALMHSAHSPEQYQKLSNHFRAEATRFTQRAEEQEATMQRELQRPTRLKYPSAYDIASRLRDYYRQRAQQAASKAACYDRLIQSPAPRAIPR